MKKIFNILMAMCLSAGFMFTGCGKEEEKNDEKSSMTTKNGKFIVTAKVENGNDYNSQIDRVKFYTCMRLHSEDKIIVEGKYSNGGFTLEFPQTVDESRLETIRDIIVNGFGVRNANISDPNAKITAFGMDDQEIFAYKSDRHVGEFWYDNINTSTLTGTYTNFVYASKDVSVTLYSTEITINISLKKGWNPLYIGLGLNSVKVTVSSSPVGGGLKWKYYSGDGLPF